MTSLNQGAGVKVSASALHGFRDPVFDSQRVFRVAVMAMARPGQPQVIENAPGEVLDLPDIEGVHMASLAWLLAFADIDTPVWLEDRLGQGVLPQYLRFHTGAEITTARPAAGFALFAEDYHTSYFEDFSVGLEAYPEQSTTLIIQTHDLSSGTPRVIRGPGIPSTATLEITGVGDQFWDAWRHNQSLYPCGLDVVLTTAHAIMGLPRSTVEG